MSLTEDLKNPTENGNWSNEEDTPLQRPPETTEQVPVQIIIVNDPEVLKEAKKIDCCSTVAIAFGVIDYFSLAWFCGVVAIGLGIGAIVTSRNVQHRQDLALPRTLMTIALSLAFVGLFFFIIFWAIVIYWLTA